MRRIGQSSGLSHWSSYSRQRDCNVKSFMRWSCRSTDKDRGKSGAEASSAYLPFTMETRVSVIFWPVFVFIQGFWIVTVSS